MSVFINKSSTGAIQCLEKVVKNLNSGSRFRWSATETINVCFNRLKKEIFSYNVKRRNKGFAVRLRGRPRIECLDTDVTWFSIEDSSRQLDSNVIQSKIPARTFNKLFRAGLASPLIPDNICQCVADCLKNDLKKAGHNIENTLWKQCTTCFVRRTSQRIRQK